MRWCPRDNFARVLAALHRFLTAANKWPVDKKALDDTIARRTFVIPSFEIHGGVAGLYDYGPPGCALKENMIALWRQHFVLEDSILQIECTTLTSYPVLKASGAFRFIGPCVCCGDEGHYFATHCGQCQRW